jgi:hypothetical protein
VQAQIDASMIERGARPNEIANQLDLREYIVRSSTDHGRSRAPACPNAEPSVTSDNVGAEGALGEKSPTHAWNEPATRAARSGKRMPWSRGRQNPATNQDSSPAITPTTLLIDASCGTRQIVCLCGSLEIEIAHNGLHQVH